jgi:hypothetical protein
MFPLLVLEDEGDHDPGTLNSDFRFGRRTLDLVQRGNDCWQTHSVRTNTVYISFIYGSDSTIRAGGFY